MACDERWTRMIETLAALRAEREALEAVAEAARDLDGCGELCRSMTPYRGCTCGGAELRIALDALDAVREGSR